MRETILRRRPAGIKAKGVSQYVVMSIIDKSL